MRLAIMALMLMSGTAAAQAPRGPDPRIRSCELVEQAYGKWAYDFRTLLERNSSDRGGRVDAGLIGDVNFALASAGDFVHTNIQVVQRAGAWGSEPSVRSCQDITAEARDQIEQYARHLIRDVHPADRWGRGALLQEFRLGLLESTRRFQGY